MPSLVTLVCASAGNWPSASAPAASPSAFNDLIMSFSSPLAIVVRGDKAASIPRFSENVAALRHRPVTVHGVDLAGVALVHKASLQFHGRRQLFILRRQLALDQIELLDGLDPREIGVDGLDLDRKSV